MAIVGNTGIIRISLKLQIKPYLQTYDGFRTTETVLQFVSHSLDGFRTIRLAPDPCTTNMQLHSGFGRLYPPALGSSTMRYRSKLCPDHCEIMQGLGKRIRTIRAGAIRFILHAEWVWLVVGLRTKRSEAVRMVEFVDLTVLASLSNVDLLVWYRCWRSSKVTGF